MQRDDFKCVKCHNDEKTLHVHHKSYTQGKLPWDYPDNNFETLCANCHTSEHSEIEIIEGGILSVQSFIDQNPLASSVFSKIENHKGNWDLYLLPDNTFTFPQMHFNSYQNNVLSLAMELYFYIQAVDRHIFVHEYLIMSGNDINMFNEFDNIFE